MTQPPPTDRADAAPGSSPSPSTGRSSSPAAPPAPAARRIRKRWWILALVLVTPILALLILTRSPLTTLIVEAQCRRLIGVAMNADSAVVRFDGSVVVRGGHFLIENVPGEAARFLRFDRCVVHLDWSSPTEPRATSIRLTRPTVLLSTGTETGTLNITELTLLAPGGANAVDLPEVIADDARIEIAEHDASGSVDVLRTLVADGRLGLSDDQTRYEVVVRERAAAAREPIEIKGHIDDERMRFRVSAINLASWKPDSFPEPIRKLAADLDAAGTIRDIELEIEPGEAIRLNARLERVALNLPVDLRGEPADATIDASASRPGERQRLARMTEVSGTFALTQAGLTAELSGILEDLPYRAELVYRADEPGEPFTCRLTTTGYELTRDPALLPFLPSLVAERLRDFSAPTATLDAEIVIERAAAPSEASPRADIDTRGWVTVRDGRSSFERFPYPFENLSGVFFFDDEKVEVQLAGRNPETGATVEATGLFTPPTEDARVELTVRARNVPVDHVLKQGLRSRGEILDALFVDGHAQTLADRGLLDPERPFHLGGTGDIVVLVTREVGPTGRWGWSAEATFDELGLIPARLPLPIIGRGVRLEIGEETARLAEGEFTTLDGDPLAITLEASVDPAAPPQDSQPADAADRPAVPIRATVRAERLPIDARLRAALELAPDARSERAATLLDRLRVVGTARLDAQFTEQGRESSWALRLEPTELTAQPMGLRSGNEADPVSLRDIRGTLDLRPEQAVFDLTAEVTGRDAASASVRVSGTAGLGQDPPPYELEVLAESFDASLALERVVDAFSTEAAARLARAREQYAPVGVADLQLNIASDGSDDDIDYRVALTRIRGGSFLADRTRLGFGTLEGRVEIEPGLVRFDNVRGALTVDGVGQTEFALDGGAALAALDPGAPPTTDRHTLQINAQGLDLSSPLTSLLLERALDADDRAQITELEPAGLIDANLTATTGPAAGDPSAIALAGTLRPRSLAFTRRAERIEIDTIEGAISFDDRGARTEALTLRASTWTARLAGSLETPESSAHPSLTGSLTIDTEGLPPPLRALLPANVDEALRSLDLSIEGPTTIELSELSILFSDDEPTIDLKGLTRFSRARADIGVDLTEAVGRAVFEVSKNPDDPAARYAIDFEADALRADGVRMTRVLAGIRNGDLPGEVRVPEFTAACYGGIVAGSFDVLRAAAGATPTTRSGDGAPEGPPAVRTYDVRVRASDVRLKPVLDDLQLADTGEPSDEPTRSSEEDAGTAIGIAPDSTRGVLSGELLLGGVLGEASRQRGRGSFRVSDGRVLDFPLAMPIIQVSNLQLPTSGRFDLALISFYIEHGAVVFDELSAFSSSIELYGYGTMSLPERELDLWFSSTASRPIPVVSDLVEGLRDELVMARVTGPVSDPAVSTTPLRSASRLVGNLLSGGPSPEERRLDEIRRRAAAERTRIKRAGDRVRSLITVSPTAPPEPDPAGNPAPDG